MWVAASPGLTAGGSEIHIEINLLRSGRGQGGLRAAQQKAAHFSRRVGPVTRALEYESLDELIKIRVRSTLWAVPTYGFIPRYMNYTFGSKSMLAYVPCPCPCIHFPVGASY